MGVLCALTACVNAGSSVYDLGMALARLSEAVVCLWALLTWHVWGVDVPLPLVTFDLWHTPPNPSMSVNELED